LAKVLHPDKRGRTEDFQEMANQFEAFKPQSEKFKGEHTVERKGICCDHRTIDEPHNIVIEIVGSFVWVSGDTKPVKDQIKAVKVGESYKNATWHKTKSMWFFSPTGYRRFSKGEYAMDDIREYYGSTVVNNHRNNFRSLVSVMNMKRLFIVSLLIVVPILAFAQEVNKAKAKEICEVYRNLAIPYFTTYEKVGETANAEIARSNSMVLKVDLESFIGGLSMKYFESLSTLTDELKRFLKTKYNEKQLPTEYYEEVYKKLEEKLL
jgi:hypothetical protein